MESTFLKLICGLKLCKYKGSIQYWGNSLVIMTSNMNCNTHDHNLMVTISMLDHSN